MNTIFYIAASIGIISTIIAIMGRNAIHSLLYLIISLLSISVVFYLLGAHFVAALEVIIYAGAIMVLFIFVVMMLNLGMQEGLEKKWLKPKMWIFPVILASALLLNFIFALKGNALISNPSHAVVPKQVGISLFTVYLIPVEISAILLLAGIIGAFHFGKRKGKSLHRFFDEQSTSAKKEINY